MRRETYEKRRKKVFSFFKKKFSHWKDHASLPNMVSVISINFSTLPAARPYIMSNNVRKNGFYLLRRNRRKLSKKW